MKTDDNALISHLLDEHSRDALALASDAIAGVLDALTTSDDPTRREAADRLRPGMQAAFDIIQKIKGAFGGEAS